jgi:ribosomal protein L37E
MKHHCPKCQRVLYNRRLKNCGFCGAPIPEELRFTPEETAALERKAAELEASRRQRQLAQEAMPIVQPSVIVPIIIP